jgi:hypothetical protein
MTQPLQHPKPPKLANERTGLNDKHLHKLGVTTQSLVVENTELTEAIHDHFMKKRAS